MIHLLAAVAIAAPAAPLSVFDAPAPVDGSRCSILGNGLLGPAGNMYCCESCHHPYLLTNEAVELSVVKTDTAFSASRNAWLDLEDNGSGDLVATQSTSVIAVSALKELQQKITMPCGRCIPVTECSQLSGRLELWHHQCLV
jgi:hypothetical protein